MMDYNNALVQSNINDIWIQHNLSDYKQGSRWYREANGFSLSIANQYKVEPIIVAGVTSALSPKKSWEVNKNLVSVFFSTDWKAVKHWYRQSYKAYSIQNLINPTTEDIDKELHGLKTVNFFHNIYNPRDTNWLTIDSHMIRIALGNHKNKLTIKQYSFLKQEYLKFAENIGINPVTLQATLWCCFKRVKGEV